jgi:hypothetical protein
VVRVAIVGIRFIISATLYHMIEDNERDDT